MFHSTLVFVLEDNAWKIVLRHASVPAPNKDTTGHEHAAIQALVDAALQGFSLGQREGLASVMFTDIVDSSAIAETVGDTVWSGAVKRHLETLSDLISAGGGRLIKTLGDGTMSTYPSARQALQTARDIQTAMSGMLDAVNDDEAVGRNAADGLRYGPDIHAHAGHRRRMKDGGHVGVRRDLRGIIGCRDKAARIIMRDKTVRFPGNS